MHGENLKVSMSCSFTYNMQYAYSLKPVDNHLYN